MASNGLPSTSSEVIAKPNLSQYVFTDKLGSGSYATVYKAYRKTGIREVVAIKCVLKSSLNKASTENLLTEIELLKNLKHEHIVGLKDFQWDSSYIYLIMEFCCGGDLSKFIRSRRALPENVVKRFLQQIASAMKFLWDNNVAHMDLKPQNILLTSVANPQLKLADFGFAKHLYDGDNLHVMRGSPLYMAPEIICKGIYDNRVDLWSIGVILYECLCGKAPFASRTFKELGEKIWNSKPVEIPPGIEISDKARDITLRLLKRDPQERITFEEFFAHPFIDMEHIPSKNSLQKAIEIVSNAVKKDQEGDYKSAVKLYCEALEFFMSAIHYEKSQQKKNSLRAKVKQYMDRAETLKQEMKPQNSSHLFESTPEVAVKHKKSDVTVKEMSPKKEKEESKEDPKPKLSSDNIDLKVLARSMSHGAVEEIMKLCDDSQELLAVLKLVKAALSEEEQDNYEQCLYHYEVALGAILKLLPAEPKGKRKELLNAQVSKWMKKAENIKAYLELKNLNTKDTSAQDEETENQYLSESKQCSVQ